MTTEATEALLNYLKELTLLCVTQSEKITALEAAVRKSPEVGKDYPRAAPATSDTRGVFLSNLGD